MELKLKGVKFCIYNIWINYRLIMLKGIIPRISHSHLINQDLITSMKSSLFLKKLIKGEKQSQALHLIHQNHKKIQSAIICPFYSTNSADWNRNQLPKKYEAPFILSPI